VQKKTPKIYNWLYFDLDNTLWDFKQNSEITLKKLLHEKAPELTGRENEFFETYYPINDKLWSMYRQGLLPKETLRWQRFRDTFAHFGTYPVEWVKNFEETYIAQAPLQTALFPQTIEILQYLKNKGYRMYLITNGFKEVQDVKIRTTGLIDFFDQMFTSDEVGYQKPHRKIFEHAVKSVNAIKKQSLMIGDDYEIDIKGAKAFGMDQVFFNTDKIKHNGVCTYEIELLSDLMLIL